MSYWSILYFELQEVLAITTYSYLFVVVVNTQIKGLSFLFKREKALTHLPTLILFLLKEASLHQCMENMYPVLTYQPVSNLIQFVKRIYFEDLPPSLWIINKYRKLQAHIYAFIISLPWWNSGWCNYYKQFQSYFYVKFSAMF